MVKTRCWKWSINAKLKCNSKKYVRTVFQLIFSINLLDLSTESYPTFDISAQMYFVLSSNSGHESLIKTKRSMLKIKLKTVFKDFLELPLHKRVVVVSQLRK